MLLGLFITRASTEGYGILSLCAPQLFLSLLLLLYLNAPPSNILALPLLSLCAQTTRLTFEHVST